MIPYRLPEEKQTLLNYAQIKNDDYARGIIAADEIKNKEEALHIANLYWQMVDESVEASPGSPLNIPEYILEKILITLMGYFRKTGYEQEWDEVSDRY